MEIENKAQAEVVGLATGWDWIANVELPDMPDDASEDDLLALETAWIVGVIAGISGVSPDTVRDWYPSAV